MRMKTDEDSLALAAAGGDADAFAALLERCYDRVFALSFRLMGARAEAEDLCQDVCAALPAKLSAFRGEAKFGTWLYRVVVNAAHDRRRRMRAHAQAARGWGDWEIARRDAVREEAERADWLMSCLARLPDDLRDTLVLVLDGLTHAQVGEVLGLSEGTISWRVSEARRHLRQMHEEDQV